VQWLKNNWRRWREDCVMGFSPLRPMWDKLQVGDREDVKEAIAALQESEW
jgi:hypothetical protein